MRVLKTAVFMFIAATVAAPALAKPVVVQGDLEESGNERKGHVRSSPNKSRLDNYDTRGRINPRTGKPGKKEPFRR